MNGVPDQFADLLFPMQGLDISVEFELQPPGTTDSGTNVRAYEPLAGRQRGGSRPGMVKYVDGLTAAGASVIQLLDTIVDPTVDALLASFDDPGFNGDTVILDPSTNNFAPVDDPYGGGASETGNPVGDGFTLARNPMRRIREGGSGIPPNRHRAGTGTVTPPPPPPPPAAWAFKQEKHQNYPTPTSSASLTFDADVTQGSLIVVAVSLIRTDNIDFSPNVSVSDNEGTTYLQAGPYYYGVYTAIATTVMGIGLFYGVWDHVSGSATVTLDLSGAVPSQVSVAILEYAGNMAAPGDGGAGNFNNALQNDPAALTAGTPAVSAANDLLVAAFMTAFEDDIFTAGSGFTTRVNLDTVSSTNLFVQDAFNVSAATEATASINGVNGYAGVSATFKKA